VHPLVLTPKLLIFFHGLFFHGLLILENGYLDYFGMLLNEKTRGDSEK
jgi:hypothetical protein